MKVAALSAKWTQMIWAREHKTTARRVCFEALLFLLLFLLSCFFFLVFCDVASVNVIGRNWSVQDSSLSQVDRLPQRGVVCVPEMGRHTVRCQRTLREAAASLLMDSGPTSHMLFLSHGVQLRPPHSMPCWLQRPSSSTGEHHEGMVIVPYPIE